MIYLLENEKGEWFKNLVSERNEDGSTIAQELQLTTDATLAWQFTKPKDARDYLKEQSSHIVFGSQNFKVTEYEFVDDEKIVGDGVFISPVFGDRWKDHVIKNYPVVIIADIALKQGRRAIWLEEQVTLLKGLGALKQGEVDTLKALASKQYNNCPECGEKLFNKH